MPTVKDPVHPGHLRIPVASQNCLSKGRLSGTFITGLPSFHCSCRKGGDTLTHFPTALVCGFSNKPVAESRNMDTMHLRWHTEKRLTSSWDAEERRICYTEPYLFRSWIKSLFWCTLPTFIKICLTWFNMSRNQSLSSKDSYYPHLKWSLIFALWIRKRERWLRAVGSVILRKV